MILNNGLKESPENVVNQLSYPADTRLLKTSSKQNHFINIKPKLPCPNKDGQVSSPVPFHTGPGHHATMKKTDSFHIPDAAAHSYHTFCGRTDN